MERRWWMSFLNDLYGDLLTEKQRHFFRLHYEEDLSFGEIASQHDVSRPAVHSAVKRAEELLLKYENKLGFASRLVKERKTLQALDDILKQLDGTLEADERRMLKKALELVASLKRV